SSFDGWQRWPSLGFHGPWTRKPKRCPGPTFANNRASRSWSLRVGESWFHFPVRRRDKDRRSQRPRKKCKNWSPHRHKKHPMGSYFRARFWPSVVRSERSIATLRLVYINFLHTKGPLKEAPLASTGKCFGRVISDTAIYTAGISQVHPRTKKRMKSTGIGTPRAHKSIHPILPLWSFKTFITPPRDF